MRKILLSILLAGVAASPALAQDRGDGEGRWHHDQQQADHQQADHQQARAERQQVHEERQQPREEVRQAPQQRLNGFNAEQQQRAAQVEAARQQQGQQWQGRGGQRNGGGDAARQQAFQQQQQQQQQVVEQQQRQAFERRDRGNFDGRQGERARQWQNRNGAVAQQWQGRDGANAQQWQGRNQGNRYANNWNRSWRNDSRYDWHRYRNSHRSVFHLGIYFDPFGYGYQPFDIGYQLYPAYYGQQYWIDPAMYGLPYPPPGAMWVRYWNDALLVDTYSGQVIDVIHDFFW